MILKNIELRHFRNYDKLQINLNKGINIIYGENGGGKTNILESIYVLTLTKSHRALLNYDLIKSGQEKALIKGTMLNEIPYNLEISLSKSKKQVKLDENPVNKLGEYISMMNVIIFYSEDLELIRGFPQTRRKYLNLQLSQISKNYYNTLNDYNKLLKVRNEYLKKISNHEEYDIGYFEILTEYLIEKSVFIYQMRQKYIERLNKICPQIYKDITKSKNFKIKYLPSIDFTSMDKETIRKEMSENLKNNYEKEVRFKTTLYGPHRDDFIFTLNDENLKNYGSQGQQRVAVLTLKLSEIQIFKDYKQNNPIVLLDDVFSELDNSKKNNLLKYINGDMQVIITTTDLDNIDSKIQEEAKLINIKHEKIVEEVK